MVFPEFQERQQIVKMLRKGITYIKNIISFSCFFLLGRIFKKQNSVSNRILFTHLATIGDLIISSIILHNVDLFEHSVYFLIRKEFKKIYCDYSGPAHLLLINYNLYKWFIPYRIVFLYKIRRYNFHMTYNLDHNRLIMSDEIALYSGSKYTIAVSYETKKLIKLFQRYINSKYDSIYFSNGNVEFDKYSQLIHKITGRKVMNKTIFYLNSNTRNNLNEKLEIHNFSNKNTLICISPITSSKIKNWPLTYYKKLIELLLIQKNIFIVIIGGRKERAKLNKLKKDLNNEKIINLSGQLSINESAAVIERSKLFIGNDSGMLHVSKALNIPSIGIIGGGSLNFFHPYNDNTIQVLKYFETDCIGCEWICIRNAPLCLNNITVDSIYKTSMRLLTINAT